MARSIEKTPIIEGKDAKMFRESFVNSFNLRFSSSEIEKGQRELRELKNAYNVVVNASNGVFY
jgi:hypothetical protein